MNKESIIEKVNRKICYEVRKRLRGQAYLLTFTSYWHYLICSHVLKKKPSALSGYYYAARPHCYAGIGHQMANWIAGYWYAQCFGLKFAHIPFAGRSWDSFLGFGVGEAQFFELIDRGYKVCRLPGFNEECAESVSLQRKIMQSYSSDNIVFLAAQDQFYKAQYGVVKEIQAKYFASPARKSSRIKFDASRYNIAVHVRRSVIIAGKVVEEDDNARSMRWLSNDYYEKVLRSVLQAISLSKPISIWIFSTGKADEFSQFGQFGDVNICSDMNEYESFEHLVLADLLITSKSSFSYKPALLSRGIKVCPRNFWHGYPESKEWILCENDGDFDLEKLKALYL